MTFLYHRASKISFPDGLPIDSILLPLFSSTIDKWEAGYVYLLEGTTTKKIHEDIHYVILQGIISRWGITLIDAANCFNPQLLDDYSQRNGLSSSYIFDAINLSRPFQLFQVATIVEKIYHSLSEKTNQLIILTNFPSLFYGSDVDECQDSGLSVTEIFHQTVGQLQRLARSGNIIIFTERTLGGNDPKLSFAANIHIRFERLNEEYITSLLVAHPSFPFRMAKQRVLRTKKSTQQLSLEDFF